LNLTVFALADDFTKPADPTPRDSKFVSNRALERNMESPFAASWKNVPLRDILRAISQQRNVSVLCDRRIDPTTRLIVDLNSVRLSDSLADLANRVEAGVSVAGNTVCVGPRESMARLRTLIQLRTNELVVQSESWPTKKPFFGAMQALDIHWNDLDEPRHILQATAQRYGLAVEGLQQIPHDLWHEATLPEVNAPEAMSLILNQFELTFEWSDDGTSIRVVPIPKAVFIELRYTPSEMTPDEAARRCRTAIPRLVCEATASEVIVRGTVEQHEVIDSLLNHPQRARHFPTPAKPTPLARRRFTLSLRRAPLASVLVKLKEQGINVRYDEPMLNAAGIDLTRKITLKVDMATPEEFFQAICTPFDMAFSIDGDVVTLSSKE